MNESALFDIAIVGRGPAAAAALIALRDAGLRVGVIAPPQTSGDRVGETLSPAAKPVLKELGIYDRFLEEGHRRAQTTFSSWGTDQLVERHAILNVEGGGWYLDRNRFETFLWNCADGVATCEIDSALADAHTGCDHFYGANSGIGADVPKSLHNKHATRAQPTEFGWSLKSRDGRELSARFVIDCSGRSAVFAGRLAGRRREDTLVAACSFLEQVDTRIEPTAATVIEARPEGWWYSALIPDGRLVVCAFTDRDLLNAQISDDAEAWRQHIEATTWTARRIESAGFAVTGVPSFATAASTRLDEAAGTHWAAAGDAAAAFDPLSSHGLTTALWTGRQSAAAATAALNGDASSVQKYAADVAAGVLQYRMQRQRIYGQEHRFRNEPFWQRRQRAEPADDSGS